jgi:hypothetical protein
MADYYVDHGAYATNIGAAPTWGVPQEGDGSAKDAATASSIGSVLFGSVPTSGTISVCGVSISTTGVLSAGSVDAAANALASNINATTTAVGSTVAIGVPQLRNLVFARGPSGGAAAGTCEIMMRVGSTTLNHASNVNVAIAQTLSPAATLTQFAGGSGGCWGWLVNSAAIGVSSSIAAYTYGLKKAYPIAWVAAPTNLDVINVRSGNNPTITITSASNVNLSRSVITSNLFASHFVIDTNTVWTSDSATGTFTLEVNLSSTASLTLPGVASGSNTNVQAYGASLRCMREGNFVLRMSTSSGAVRNAAFDAGVAEAQGCRYHGVLFEDVSTGAGAMQVVNNTVGTGGGSRDLGAYRFVRCTFRRVNLIADTLPVKLIAASSVQLTPALSFEACKFEANVSGATADPVVHLSLATGGGSPVGYGQYFTLLRCKFSGWSAGNNKFALHDAAPAGLTRTQILAQDCEGLSLTAAYAGVAHVTQVQDRNRSFVSIHSAAIGGAWRYENLDGVLEWNPEASPVQPTFSAAFSVHARWLATLGVVDRNRGFQLAADRLKFVGTSGTKTFRKELLISSDLFAALKPGDFVATLSYVSDTTGLMVSECVESLSASSAAWTAATGFPSHIPKALTLTTSEPVRTGCEVSVSVTLYGQPRTLVSESIFLDPEFTL